MKNIKDRIQELGELNDRIGALRTMIWNLNKDLTVGTEGLIRVHYAEFKALLKEVSKKVAELDRLLQDDDD